MAMAIFLGAFLAKLISLGGLVGLIAGYQRSRGAAAVGFLVGTIIEIVLHATMHLPSQIGYLAAPLAVAAAVGIGWGIARRRRGATPPLPSDEAHQGESLSGRSRA